jgi:ABC-type transport system substrate-binding protein
LMASLLSGECDLGTDDVMSPTQLPFLQQSASRGLINYVADPGTVWEHIDFNTWAADTGNVELTTPFMADTRVRQAIGYGTNRQQMTEEILFGEVSPLNSYLPADHWAYNPEVDGMYGYDPDKAKSLLTEAGWEDKDGDGTVEAQSALKGDYSCGRGSWSIPAGTPFKVTLWIPAVPSVRAQLATIFQSNMKDIGIDVALNQVPSASALFADGGPLFTRKYDLAEFAWVAGPDPGYLLTYGGENVYGWDPEQQPDLTPGDTGPFLVAGKILEQNPKILDGTGITEEMFKFGRPIAADAEAAPNAANLEFGADKLPASLTLQVAEQIPEIKDNQEGSNDVAWCNEDGTQALFDGENVIEPNDRLSYTQAAQKFFMDDLPVLPLFQRLKVEAWATDLCGIASGPANYITWNVETWYFAAPGETCPAASE